MINTDKQIIKVREAISDDKFGLSITDIVKKTKLKRCQVRTAIAFLCGSKEVEERQIGMAKVYTLRK